MATISTYHNDISPLDALWTLYRSQSKRVRKAFYKRVLLEQVADMAVENRRSYEQQLSDDMRNSVCLMAKSIQKSAEEVRQATLNKTHVGRRAEDFLNELEQEKS